jgi:hypothetical protein
MRAKSAQSRAVTFGSRSSLEGRQFVLRTARPEVGARARREMVKERPTKPHEDSVLDHGSHGIARQHRRSAHGPPGATPVSRERPQGRPMGLISTASVINGKILDAARFIKRRLSYAASPEAEILPVYYFQGGALPRSTTSHQFGQLT